jgi:hypothetical protein
LADSESGQADEVGFGASEHPLFEILTIAETRKFEELAAVRVMASDDLSGFLYTSGIVVGNGYQVVPIQLTSSLVSPGANTAGRRSEKAVGASDVHTLFAFEPEDDDGLLW